jgi:hypothetical protein
MEQSRVWDECSRPGVCGVTARAQRSGATRGGSLSRECAATDGVTYIVATATPRRRPPRSGIDFGESSFLFRVCSFLSTHKFFFFL